MTHPGLNFKPWKNRADVWSVRVGGHYRALCTKDGDDWIWFWIGTHEEYNGLY